MSFWGVEQVSERVIIIKIKIIKLLFLYNFLSQIDCGNHTTFTTSPSVE